MTSSPEQSSRRLRVRVSELIGRPGAHKDYAVEMSIDGLVLPTTDVRISEPLQLAFAFATIVDGLALTGTIGSAWEASCRRCLEPVTGVIDVTVDELCSDDPEEGETWPIDNDHVDLEPIARELALLALPLSVLCGDDCVGPDPERFPARPEDEALVADEDAGDAVEPEGDPRWAALDDLKFDES